MGMLVELNQSGISKPCTRIFSWPSREVFARAQRTHKGANGIIYFKNVAQCTSETLHCYSPNYSLSCKCGKPIH